MYHFLFLVSYQMTQVETLNLKILNKNMLSLYLPSILVPLVGLVFPAIAMASLFLYIEKEQIS